MKQKVKKIIEVILTIIAGVSFVMLFAEKPDGSINLPWSLGWAAALLVSGSLLNKMGVLGREGSR